jgi:bifunctional non-homologous end joining protein LigD
VASIDAGFIAPMLLLRTDTLPQGGNWQYELKLDGYRAVAFKSRGTLHLRSRNDNDFRTRYPAVVAGLAGLPDETVVDGEVVAVDANGRPSFAALQHASSASIRFFVFDVMVLAGKNLRHEPLTVRRRLLEQRVLPTLREPVRYAAPLDADLRVLVASVRTHGLEGLVAKRLDSRYEAGRRSGAWMKMRVDRSQEFVIGGYTVGTRSFDAVILGYYEGNDLLYVARTRNGFTPATRAQLFRRFQGLAIERCPFANLPEARSGRWGQGLTRAKMAECRWLDPVLVAQIEFLEWTGDNHLRHSRFIALRDDKSAREVGRA